VYLKETNKHFTPTFLSDFNTMKQQVLDLTNQVKEYAFKQDRLEQNFNKIQ